MNKILASLLVTSLIAVSGRAEPAAPPAPPTQASIDRLLVAAKAQDTFDSMGANIDKMVRRNVQQAIPGQKLTPSDEKVLETLHAKTAALIAQDLSWAKMKDFYEQLYAAAYTQEEVDGLIAFYNSHVGQVFAEKQPEIALKTSTMMQKQIMPVVIQLRGAAREAAEQIAAAHEPAQEAAPEAEAKPDAAPSAMPAAPAAPKGN